MTAIPTEKRPGEEEKFVYFSLAPQDKGVGNGGCWDPRPEKLRGAGQ
jgi:hypothetical protein